MPKSEKSNVNSILYAEEGNSMVHSHSTPSNGYLVGHSGVWKLPLNPVSVPPQPLLGGGEFTVQDLPLESKE